MRSGAATEAWAVDGAEGGTVVAISVDVRTAQGSRCAAGAVRWWVGVGSMRLPCLLTLDVGLAIASLGGTVGRELADHQTSTRIALPYYIFSLIHERHMRHA